MKRAAIAFVIFTAVFFLGSANVSAETWRHGGYAVVAGLALVGAIVYLVVSRPQRQS